VARIRTVKPEFWTDEQVMELSPLARLLFIGMWNFCDDRGVHPASTKTLKAEVFPADDITADQIGGLVTEMIRQGLLTEFEAQGRRWWAVTGWHHQMINRPSTSKYPAPPAKNGTDSGNPHGRLSEDSVSAHGGLPAGREGKGEESKYHLCASGEGGGVGEVSASPSAPPPPSRLGTRLAADWSLPAPWRDWARQQRPDLDITAVADRFRDHWLSKPGKDGRKADWEATWRNWIRRENGNGNHRETAADRHRKSVAILDAAVADCAASMGGGIQRTHAESVPRIVDGEVVNAG
jgi:hypothetical protein